jgi:CheY-like chemotaxis protein
MFSAAMNILLIEDNPGDRRLTLEALREAGWTGKPVMANDGSKAMHFLQKEATSSDRPRLIILDLNLPGKDGREVLAEIKNDPGLRRIPVVVLSSSESQDDIERSYDLNANCYITKPVDLDEYYEMVRSLESFWLGTAELPDFE